MSNITVGSVIGSPTSSASRARRISGLLTAVVLLLGCSAGDLRSRSTDGAKEPLERTIDRLVDAEYDLRLPNSHCRTPEELREHLARSRRTLDDLTIGIARGMDSELRWRLFARLDRAGSEEPPDVAAACCVVRVLVAGGERVEEDRLPSTLSTWRDVVRRCIVEGMALRGPRGSG
jgi:hypothetical protein